MHFDLLEPQRIMVDHMAANDNALLFCGMGLSKTAAVLQHLSNLFLNAEARSALIIAPLRVSVLTWPMEVNLWDQFRWMKIVSLRTDAGQRTFLNGTAHIYTINFESIPLLVSLVERRRGTIPYDVLVVDESTKAKNPSSKRINLYRRKVPRPKRNYALTGTPMPNSWLDLFAQVRLVDDGKRLGSNYLAFKKEYFYGSEYTFAPWKPKAGTTKLLEEKISDITVTLKSSDWLDIPDTVIEDVEVHFTKELRERYEKLESDLVIELKENHTMNVANAASLVTKLLQFTSGHMYDEQRKVHAIHNLKFDALKKIAKAEDSPLFVAYMFQHEEQRLRENFPEARFFSDAKNATTQTALLKEWNAGKIPMLCSHPASVGHGLNLQHGGNALAWISLTYSREYYEQMICRFARRGQANVVRVYRLMVPGTVDDAVATALSAKAENEARLISALQMLESFRGK